MATTVVAHGGSDRLGHGIQISHDLVQWAVDPFSTLACGLVQVADVGCVMPVVVNLHRLCIDVRLVLGRRIGQRIELEETGGGCADAMHGARIVAVTTAAQPLKSDLRSIRAIGSISSRRGPPHDSTVVSILQWWADRVSAGAPEERRLPVPDIARTRPRSRPRGSGLEPDRSRRAIKRALELGRGPLGDAAATAANQKHEGRVSLVRMLTRQVRVTGRNAVHQPKLGQKVEHAIHRDGGDTPACLAQPSNKAVGAKRLPC